MFFQEPMRIAILAGLKGETRRIWKRPHVKVGGIYKVRKGRYSRDYHFKIKVLALDKQRLGDMTEEDAIEEGFVPGKFSALGQFMTYWIMDLKRKWIPDQEVYVVRFELVDEPNEEEEIAQLEHEAIFPGGFH